ncbi:hypothetical protein K1T71_011524 [Dendrolimus kikuchii]|uniref:Uncharacterized protein n=1 Tax=Dendrolimus kikuchii TaxID=765133 RepID=A0ACC1CP37_9NEOP|nr:hypothetical protein K1T71_011524 [Dendrolimus kikuchii]
MRHTPPLEYKTRLRDTEGKKQEGRGGFVVWSADCRCAESEGIGARHIETIFRAAHRESNDECLTEEKPRKKLNATLTRENKTQKLAEEKAAKQHFKEMNKIYKPGECMKYMSIDLHPTLSDAWYMADLSREISSSGAKITKTSSLCDPALLMWSRVVPPKLTSNDGQVKLAPLKESCKCALYISTLEEIAEHIINHSLAQHIMQICELSGCKVTLVIFGVKEYFKPEGRKKNGNKKCITEIDLEMAITDLIVTSDADAVCVNTPNQLALLIVQYTKAIAEEPYKKSKRLCEENAEFYMKGDNKKCVPIDKDGNGVARVWQQMIAILPLSSLEISRAICGQYKSPLALYDALQSPNGVNELADIGVARAAVPGSLTRRVGPEFARKLHMLFTAEDGNVLLE